MIRRALRTLGHAALWMLAAGGMAFLSAAPAADAGEDAAAFSARLRDADQRLKDGQYAEALDAVKSVFLDPAYRVPPGDPDGAATGGFAAIRQALARLNRHDELDGLLDGIVAAHPDDPWMLGAAADALADAPPHGQIVAGVFARGRRGRGGRFVDAARRDRARALGWYARAAARLAPDLEGEPGERNAARERAGRFFLRFARRMLNHAAGHAAWRLTALTDLSVLPDYDTARRPDATLGAPVDAEGRPWLHAVPASWEAAKTDGERWRWLLDRAERGGDACRRAAWMERANFLHEHFGVQTMAWYGAGAGRNDEPDADAQDGPFAVRTLRDDETIARLATGVRRFAMPPEHDFLRLFGALADEGDGTAKAKLVEIFRNRMQYPKAAALLRENFGDGKYPYNRAREEYDDLVQPAGSFAPAATLPAGRAPTLNLLFRNARRVRLAAYRLDEQRLLDDVRRYYKSDPREFKWDKARLDNLGYRVVVDGQQKYVREKVAEWLADLDPADGHFTRRAPLVMPFDRGGAYLVTATFDRLSEADGGSGREAEPGVSRAVVWLADLALIRKDGTDGVYFHVADARTGAPVEGAQLDLFGYRHTPEKNRRRTATQELARTTDADGGVWVEEGALSDQYQWLAAARAGAGDDARLAWLGFSPIWMERARGARRGRGAGSNPGGRAFVLSDRPVYRPGHTVELKAWVGHNDYDRDGASPFAGRAVTLEVRDPRNQQILKADLKADAYGGVAASLPLPDGATLGQYSVHVRTVRLEEFDRADATPSAIGMGGFRVEEYRKPEFAVTVGLPPEPLALGDNVDVPVTAKYLFGAPVAGAKVAYTVTRTEHAAAWYPAWPFDWFYGSGYWWFGYDYPWWPGWRMWGRARPAWPWTGLPRRGAAPPEVVAQGEAALDADGTFSLSVDTGLAKALHGDLDHRYAVTAEVTDLGRRTVAGGGSFLAARAPYTVHAWTDRGWWTAAALRAGAPLKTHFRARAVDGRGVKASGTVTVYRVRHDDRGWPVETPVHVFDKVETDDDGHATVALNAAEPGQYRLAFAAVDAKGRAREGAVVVTVRGPAAAGEADPSWRFAALELVPDKRDYQPGDTVRLAVNTDRADATVLLFVRPADGLVRGRPQVLRLQGKTAVVEIPVEKADMPNFFVEAVTVADGRAHYETRALAVPPEKRFLTVDVAPDKEAYPPGGAAALVVTVTDADGQPFKGQCAATLYDRAVDLVAGPASREDIRAHFWKWQRQHRPIRRDSLQRFAPLVFKRGDTTFAPLGAFGGREADWEAEGGVAGDADAYAIRNMAPAGGMRMARARTLSLGGALAEEGAIMRDAAPAAVAARAAAPMAEMAAAPAAGGDVPGGDADDPLAIRENFADTAYWAGAVETDEQGRARIAVTLPESLTTWRARVWTLGDGNRVGEGEATFVTRKDFLLRMQAPRFFTQGDVATVSAILHNDHAEAKEASVELALEGGALEPRYEHLDGVHPGAGIPVKRVTVPARGQVRVDWWVKAARPGEASVTMTARVPGDGDAMRMPVPVLIHGAPRFVPTAGVLRDGVARAAVRLDVPAERLADRSRLTVQFSPSVALAAVEALPYLFQQPHETADIELHRFAPAMAARRLLADLGLDLETIAKNRANLNAAELGGPADRAAQWGARSAGAPNAWGGERAAVDAVFDSAAMARLTDVSLAKLARQQRADGGWNWMAGYGGDADAYVTAVVVRGLRSARRAGVAIPGRMAEDGADWLAGYEKRQVDDLRRYEKTAARHAEWVEGGRRGRAPDVEGKKDPTALDAFVWHVLARDRKPDAYMADRLYARRLALPVSCLALMGLTFHEHGDAERLATVTRNLAQYFRRDDETQTGWLQARDPAWWWWYNAPVEMNAGYLMLLSRVDPKGGDASRLAKWLVNNRRHRSSWDSPRATAWAIEALLDFARASGEAAPRQAVTVFLDGRAVLKRDITPESLFVADHRFTLDGVAVETGAHEVAVAREGAGPVYFNAYLEYYSLENPIPAAGLDLKVARRVFRLRRDDAAVDAATATGAAAKQRVERYARAEIPDPFTPNRAEAPDVRSGDLLEIELVVEAKNGYEYVVLEDMLPAGAEPLDPRSGYTANALGAYVEFRDEKVVFYVARLPQGRHSVSYRVRAETPGRFFALPTQSKAIYAPELRGNANEHFLSVLEAPDRASVP